MQVLVVGCGRSGTCMATEILRASGQFQASPGMEDKKLMELRPQHKNYLTKLDTCYLGLRDFALLADAYPEMRVLWMIRDPRDICLSKMYRGRLVKDGGDCVEIPSDATPEGCVEDIQHMTRCLSKANQYFEQDILLWRMESIVQNLELTIKTFCEFFEIKEKPEMFKFWETSRNKHHQKRYSGIDKTQVELWKQVKQVYQGHFASNPKIEEVFAEVMSIVRYFGYDN